MKKDRSGYLALALAPATLHILLALAGDEMHGYGIMQEVARQSEGRYKLGPGTLYDNLQRLTKQGMVQEVPRLRGSADSRRRYYRLTPQGRSVLTAEITRLEGVIRDARLRLRTMKPGRV
jgi:DNA-binding PadR family transcriptional regulator